MLLESAACPLDDTKMHVSPARSVLAVTSTCDGGQRKAPGQSAPTVRVDQLWNHSQEGPKSPLRSFIFSSFEKRHRRCNRACAPGPVWPMPLPFSMVAEKFENTDAALMRVLNLMVLVMNWLHLGQPDKAPVNYMRPQPLSLVNSGESSED